MARRKRPVLTAVACLTPGCQVEYPPASDTWLRLGSVENNGRGEVTLDLFGAHMFKRETMPTTTKLLERR